MAFSVLLSVYAKERPGNLARCLQSLCDQSLPADEVVLVEDGRITDALRDTIESFRTRIPLKSVRLGSNVGLAAALNAGLDASSNELIARMDTDDEALPHRFEKQIDYLTQHRETSIVGSWAVDVDEEYQPLWERRVPIQHEDILRLIWTCPFIHPSVMYRRNRILQLGGYDRTLFRSEDYDLWLRAALAGLRFHNIPEPLIHYMYRAQRSWRDSIRQGICRTTTGWRGCRKLNLGTKALLGTTGYFINGLVPPAFQRTSKLLFRRLDPRLRLYRRNRPGSPA